ncbi:LCP family protein [Corynebacterium glaucum]|uniref:LCP family protein n=1 Tax=Corynebacterium glaucum TaxID=187491 RepID=UPI00265AF32F|nr:LCP family protein [Corynebacterium glaucum]
MSTTGHSPHSNDPRDNLGDYVLGKDGRPIVDRYGRPVRRREASAKQPERPRGEYEPRRTPHQQRQEQQRQAAREQTRIVPQQEARQRPRQQMPSPATQQRPVQQRVRAQQRQVQHSPHVYDAYYDEPAVDVPMHVESGGRSQVSRRSRRRRKAKAPGCFAILATLLVLTLVGGLLLDARMSRIQAMPADRVANTSGTNWLLVGSDSRTGLTENDVERLGTGGDIGSTRTDTVMLLHIPRSGKATLVSLPRDSYVEIPGYGYDKLNAAFAYGGAPLLVNTVEQATGLRVHRYAEIGMGGLANVVDAVGGVEICVAEPIDDPLANINLQPGCQNMDGATGLGYVRTRATAQGDLDRVARQREFLGALMSKVMSPGVLLNPFRLIPLAWTVPSMFVVNQGDHIWNLARIPLAMRGGLETETIPLGGFMDTEVGNVVLWDDAAAAELFNSLR